jgi:plasmid stabilization system protein ParE
MAKTRRRNIMLSEQARETIRGALTYYRQRTLQFREHNPSQADKEIGLLDAALAELDADEPNEALEDFHYRRAQAEAWAKAERGE